MNRAPATAGRRTARSLANRFPAALVLLLGGLAAAPTLAAQAGQAAPPMEPEEPAIVLPEVILRTEDISVEQVEAGIPQEAEILPPERAVPLPEAGELVIQEPTLVMQPPESEAARQLEQESLPLVAEGTLGVGIMNHIYSAISLFRVEGEPRFQLKYLHDTLDGFSRGGFSWNEPGSGYFRREDSLDGSLRLHLDTLALELQGTLRDAELGLQQRSPLFSSQDERIAALRAVSTLPLGRMWSVGAGIDSHLASRLLTAPTGATSPDILREILLQPEAFARVRSGRIQFQLTGRYGYRSRIAGPADLLNRLTVNASLGVQLPREFRLVGDVSWLGSSRQGNLFPFSIALSGAPVDPLSFSLRGGYRVQQVNLLDILEQFDYIAVPATLLDNRGWFGELGATVNLFRNLILNGQAALSWNSNLPDPDVSLLDADGLFPLRTSSLVRLTSNLSLRWNPGSLFSLRAGWESEWLEKPAIIPRARLRLESEGMGSRGKWGWHGSVVVWDLTKLDQLPMVDMSGFYRVSDKIRMIFELNDILQPLQTDARMIVPPYEEPGFRGTIKVQVTM